MGFLGGLAAMAGIEDKSGGLTEQDLHDIYNNGHRNGYNEGYNEGYNAAIEEYKAQEFLADTLKEIEWGEKAGVSGGRTVFDYLDYGIFVGLWLALEKQGVLEEDINEKAFKMFGLTEDHRINYKDNPGELIDMVKEVSGSTLKELRKEYEPD